MNSPYISRAKIKNFRNFKDIDVVLGNKQVLIGENNVGKTNFLRAIQLILDPGLSDSDRKLNSKDFHDGLDNPMENGEEIVISVEIRNYEHNSQLVAQFQDALISSTPPTLSFTYKFGPQKDEEGNILDYNYIIYKGSKEDKPFSNKDRNYINIQVINALRDVEKELSSNKRSPLYKLVQQYNISEENLIEISESMQDAANEILELDEIRDIRHVLTNKFQVLAGLQYDNEINLRPYDIDIERLLYSIQVYMGLRGRPVAELSLGLANILHLSLVMLLLEDNTVPRVLKRDRYNELLEKPGSELLATSYNDGNDPTNLVLIEDIDDTTYDQLYEFFDKYSYRINSTTILAVEEPESHLHPVLQRLIYREILQKNKASVIFTTHSPYITSVAPLESIVHFRREKGASHLFSSISLSMTPGDKNDIERYLDAKRGELYFGKGVLLVEGITEEYIVPKTAELMGMSLEDMGIIVCNVHSTNFKPYVQILKELNIPWCLITDGDYYEIITEENDTGKQVTKRKYHILNKNGGATNFRGLEIVLSCIQEIGLCSEEDIPSASGDQDDFVQGFGCHVGYYTLEVDMLNDGGSEAISIFNKVYDEVKPGGEKQQKNFEKELADDSYWNALKKIDDNVGKGRFAQRLAAYLVLDMVPDYVQDAIHGIVEKVQLDE